MSLVSYPVYTRSVTATAVLTRHRFVGFNGALPSAGAAALGPVRTDAAIGDTVPVDVIGTATVEAGAAIAAGVEIQVNAAGKAITKTTGTTVARSLEAAAGDGSLIEVLLIAN